MKHRISDRRGNVTPRMRGGAALASPGLARAHEPSAVSIAPAMYPAHLGAPQAAHAAGAVEDLDSAPSSSDWVSGYSRIAPYVAIAILAVFAARLQEVFTFLKPFRPILLLSVAGTAVLAFQSSGDVIRRAFHSRILILLLCYAGWAAVMAPFAIWPVHALKTSVLLMVPAVLVCVILVLCPPTPGNLDRIALGFVLAVLVHFFSVLVLGLASGGDRLRGTDSLDPNDLASLAALTFPLAMGYQVRRRGYMRFLAATAAVLCVLVVLRTGSRGGTLALSAAALVYIAGTVGRRRLMLLAALVVAAPVTWVTAPPTFRARMMTLTTLDQDYNTFDYQGRQQIWARAGVYIKERPLTGVGFSNFELAEGAHQTSLGRTGKWSAPHNAFVQAFAELGIFGGLVFVSLLIAAGVQFWRLWRPKLAALTPWGHRPEYLASLVGFVTGSYFLSHAYFWAMFALLALAAFIGQARHAGSLAPSATRPALSPRAAGRVARHRGGRVPGTAHGA